MTIFVCVIGSVEQNIFKLEVAREPFRQLSIVQAGNPYRLSILSKICVKNKNAATLITQLSCQRFGEYEGAGGWLVGLPDGMSEQFVNGHYLRSLASRADIKPIGKETATLSKAGRLHGLSKIAEEQGLTFDDILGKVEQAYDEGTPIDKMIRN